MFRNHRLRPGVDPGILAARYGMRATARDAAIRNGRGFDAQAFDAAGASGMAFLQSQLELVDTEVVEPLQAVTHGRDLHIDLGGGFPEFISAYAYDVGSTGTQYFGLQGTTNTELPELQADVMKALWGTFIWAAAMTVTWVDLKRLATAKGLGQEPPISLQTLYEKSCATLWAKALDYLAYNGFLGKPGLINNAAIPETTAPNGASGFATWAKKTPTEILNDVNLGCNTVVGNSGYDIERAMPNRLLVPYTQFSQITQPMTTAGSISTKQYIEDQCVAKQHGKEFRILPLPNPWISGKGASSTDRALFYNRDKENQYLKVAQAPTKSITSTTMRNGGSYETGFVGCVSSVIFKRTSTSLYLDGI